MKVLIIEDEKWAADKLESMLMDIDMEISVLAKLGSVKESVRWLFQNKADLIFLDIQLSDGLSFSIFDQIDIFTPVIFTTAYDQYAIQAFDVNSIAYLLKPVRQKDLVESLKKFQYLQSAFSIDFNSLWAQLKGTKHEFKKRFLIQIGEKIRKIEVADIAYFFVWNKGVYLRTFKGSSYPVEYTLEKLENLLDPDVFFRINRKYLINMDTIVNMVAYSRGRVKLELSPAADEETDAVVSIDRSPAFKQWLNK